jgi:ABC-type multidrug transport system fused ATPase/permease subunit
MVYSVFDNNQYAYNDIVNICIRLFVFAVAIIGLCVAGDIISRMIANSFFFNSIKISLKKVFFGSHNNIRKYGNDDITGRIVSESKEGFDLIISGVNDVIYNLFMLVLAIIFLANIQMVLAVILLAVNLFIMALLKLTDKYVNTWKKQYFAGISNIRAKLQISLKNTEIIKLSGKYNEEKDELLKLNAVPYSYYVKIKILETLVNTAFPLITDICRVISLYFLINKLLSGQIQVSDIIFFLSLINRINIPFYSLLYTRTSIIESHAVFERQNEIIKDNEHKSNYAVHDFEDDTLVSFENAKYSYWGNEEEPKKYIQVDNRIKIRKGEALCVCGENGAGKTTFLLVLLDLKSLDEGQIYINSEYLNIKKDYLSRPPAIFACDLDWNMFCGEKEPENKPELYNKYSANKLENDFGNELFYNKLSGGEKSKIVFIRSETLNAPFVVLDEPEAWLDSGQKAVLINRITDMKKSGKTIVIVTHDREMMDLCDRVLLIKNGCINYK